MKKFISLVLALVMALSLTTIAWGATLQDAINAAVDGTATTITLDADTTEGIVIPAGKVIVLDLNGKTLSAAVSVIKVLDGAELTIKDSSAAGTGKVVPSAGAPNTAAALFINGGAKATLMSGTLESAGYYTVALGYGSTADTFEMSGGTVKNTCEDINPIEGVAIITDGNSGGSVKMTGGKVIAARYGVTIKKGSFTMDGGTIEATKNFAISTNGTFDGDVSVSAGTVTSTNDAAIYHASTGALNITGGTITGATGVYVKSGSVSITGGTISGTGDAADYTFNGGGCNPTGDALVVDSCNYPGGAPAVSVTGGTFTSAKAAPVASYVGNGVTAVEDEFIEGGTFSGAVAMDEDLLADDVILSATGSVVAVPSGAAIPAGGPTLAPDVDDIDEVEYASWKANVTAKKGENAKKYTFATYTIEMTAKVDGAPIWWDSGVEDKGEKVDFDIYGEEEFVKVASEAAWFAVIDGKNITYFAPASEYNTNGWDEKATKVELPYVVPSKQVCDTDYAASPAATTFYKFNGDLYVADSASTFVLNVGGVAVPASAADNGTDYVNLGHDYVVDWKNNDYGEAEVTKVYCDDCDKVFKFVNAPETVAITVFGVDKYVDTELTFGGQPIFVGAGSTIPSGGSSSSTSTDKVTSADTFDAGIALYVGMSVMAAAGSAVVIGKKRED